ncbi:hypothetical protein PV341_35075 [Streptomyces sp. PA03-1a]|nr:hypothetical protein [Streptomyces sp. PA03-1a]
MKGAYPSVFCLARTDPVKVRADHTMRPDGHRGVFLVPCAEAPVRRYLKGDRVDHLPLIRPSPARFGARSGGNGSIRIHCASVNDTSGPMTG